MDLEALYQQVILDHYRNPHGKGLREPFDAQVHHVNPTCGDEITLRLRIGRDEPGLRVDDVSYDAQGCSISQAAASVMFDQIEGQPLPLAVALGEQFAALMRSATEEIEIDEEALGDGIAFSGVARYPARIKCALLPWMAFRDAAVRAADSAGQESGDPAGANGPPNRYEATQDPEVRDEC